MTRVVPAEELLEALKLAGIAPNRTRRVVIDLQEGHLPIVHVECFGDEMLLDVVRMLEGVQIRREEQDDDDPEDDDGMVLSEPERCCPRCERPLPCPEHSPQRRRWWR